MIWASAENINNLIILLINNFKEHVTFSNFQLAINNIFITMEQEQKQDILSDIHYQQLINLLPAWKTIKRSDVTIERLTGITNVTMKATHNLDLQPKVIIVRKFGDANECCYLDRHREDKILQFLSTTGIAPRLYGYNPEIRLEEFIVSKSLESKKTLDDPILVRVGCKLQQFHSLNAEFLDKTPLMQKICTDQKYLSEAQKKWNSPIYTAEEGKILEQVKKWLCKEQLHQFNTKLKNLKNDVVFSHNDLLIGNILVKPNEDILFIDYEYACYNYRTFDFGNYFVQSMYDYDVQHAPYFTVKPQMPSQKSILRMITVYVIAGQIQDQSLRLQTVFNQQKCQEYLQKHQNLQQVIDDMAKSVPYMMMASCVFWGIWSIYMSKNPKITFDYVQFCKTRMQLYYKIKSQSKQ